MNQELIEEVNAKVVECFRKAQESYNARRLKHPHLREIKFKIPEVTFNLRGHVAGYAHYFENKIQINCVLLASNSDDIITDIVPHEVAHLIAYQIHGASIKPHGHEWREACAMVGHPKGYYADRTHSLKTTSAQNRRKYAYVCSCSTIHEVGIAVHKKMILGQIRICNTCKKEISYRGESLNSTTIEEVVEVEKPEQEIRSKNGFLTGFNPFK